MTEHKSYAMTLRVADIERLPALQVRDGMCAETIERYRELWAEGYTGFPRIWVARMHGALILIAGNHRLVSCEEAGLETIDAEVFDVDMDGALELAIKENASHPLSMRPHDKVRAVTLVYQSEKLSRLSTREIAKLVGCTHTHVGNIRKKLLGLGEITIPDRIEGADGREYPSRGKSGGNDVASEPSPQPRAKPAPRGVKGRMDAHNAAIDSWCERATELLSCVPRSEWVGESQEMDVIGHLRAAIASLRRWKASEVHSTCQGKGCTPCRGTGFVHRGFVGHV